MIASLALIALLPAPPASANPGDMWFYQRNFTDVTKGIFSLGNIGSGQTLASWRGGSGGWGVYANQECRQNVGFLPAGYYVIAGWNANWPGTAVQGPVLQLPNKVCNNGYTSRTELFVHSSYPWSADRYHSEGCIKLMSTGWPWQAGGDIAAVVFLHVVRGGPPALWVV